MDDDDDRRDDGLIRGPDCWHPPFYQLVIERGSPAWQAETEVELNKRARRIDMVLRRAAPEKGDERANAKHDRHDEARVLRGLFAPRSDGPNLGKVVVLEFKSAAEGFARPDLLTLIDYGVRYHELHMKELDGPSDVTLVLVVPGLTPSLTAAIAHMEGWSSSTSARGMPTSPEPGTLRSSCSPTRFSRPKTTRISACSAATSARTERPRVADPLLHEDDHHGRHEQDGRIRRGAHPASHPPRSRRGDPQLQRRQAARPARPSQRLADLEPEQRLADLEPEQLKQLLAALQKRLDEAQD